MDRRIFNRAGFLAGLSALLAGSARADTDSSTGNRHRLALQVSAEDPKTQAWALNSAHNYCTYYKAKGEPFAVEIVAFGPGYAMVRVDASTVKNLIEALQKEFGSEITFSACQNTRTEIAEKIGQRSDQVPQIKGVSNVPSGIVRLAELQEKGWSYIKP